MPLRARVFAHYGATLAALATAASAKLSEALSGPVRHEIIDELWLCQQANGGRVHQDGQSGSWAADSMNKVYPPDSMQVKFMRDAATSFAVLALLESGL